MLRRIAGAEPGSFTGKNVLVTGGGAGLGRGIALAFGRAGARLVLLDIDETALQDTAGMLASEGVECVNVQADVSSRGQMERAASEVLNGVGSIDVLVNNAGVGVGGELKDVPLDDIDWIVGINLLGEIYGTRLFLPGMIERGSGHIVNVASLSGLVVLPFHIPYTTTKFGLVGFSEALYAELRRFGIGVTLVCPGAVKTDILSRTRSHMGGERGYGAFMKFQDLLGSRGMDPEEAGRMVASAVLNNRFLLLTGPEAYLLYYLRRLFPGLMRRVVARITEALT